MGIVTHTIQFKPELYRPVAGFARDYHPMDWDVGSETHFATRFPFARNWVQWEELYGGWKKAGFGIDVCVMFETIKADGWKDMARDAYAYGHSFARFFGPSGTQKLVEAVEIGNEPGLYDDATYRTVFENMARGIRQGDPALKVATCALTAVKSHRWAKSVDCVKGLESLYDVITMHTYAEAEPYPTWRRSYPEDPKIKYLKDVGDLMAWRDANAPGKPLWITEFGYDATTKPSPTMGDFKQWVGSTETQQAQWLVRSFFAFAAMGVDRAYIYWFNDKDEPQLHGSSGLTRDYKPKPAYHVVAHLYKTLGNYRFTRAVVEKPGELMVYEFLKGDSADRIWAAWLPTGSNQSKEVTLPNPPGKVLRAERMSLKEGPPESVPLIDTATGIRTIVNESPVYLWTSGSTR